MSEAQGTPRKTIYCDANATTKISESTLRAMLPYLRESYGNPSSIHAEGVRARAAIEEAREKIAYTLGFRAAELVFTSCATESINSAIRGALEAHPERKKIVTSAVEHSATLDVCERLEASGVEIVRLPVERDGTLPVDRVRDALDSKTACLSLLWVNNETGVYFDIDAIGAVAREKGVFFHVDAAQYVGKGLGGLRERPVDALSFSGHKFGAPKGTGGLYLRRGAPVRPLVWGGHHEKGRRGGTENVASIVAMGAAIESYDRAYRLRAAEIAAMRDGLEAALVLDVPGLLVNGRGPRRIENTLNVSYPAIEGAAIVLTLSNRGIFVSSGSACTASQAGPSHVLTAMNVPGDRVHGSVRYSLAVDADAGDMRIVAEESIRAFRHVHRVNLG